MSRIALGKIGEDIACSYLQKKGYTIRERHFTTRWGELDIIAFRPDNTLAFIEVKTRSSMRYGKPYESMTRRKISAVSRAIQFYLLKNNVSSSKLRLELVTIYKRHDVTIHHFDDIPVLIEI